MNCKNCNTEINSNFCPGCGQPSRLKRIDRHYIVHEVEHVLHFERGILYTVKELATNPGKAINNYLAENRSRLVKPIIFIIVASLIYTFLNHFFHIEDGYVKYGEAEKTTAGLIVKWVQDHYGYANIIMSMFIALWLKIFFRKYDYNFYEILVLLCFIMGTGMLIFSFFVILQGLMHIHLMSIAGMVGVAYSVWGIGQFYDKKRIANYFKAFVAYMLGMITFWLFAFLSGTLIDLIIKH